MVAAVIKITTDTLIWSNLTEDVMEMTLHYNEPLTTLRSIESDASSNWKVIENWSGIYIRVFPIFVYNFSEFT